jgi:phosphoribosylanthranilate isomerase
MTRVKVCGITNIEDALAACQAGADALGFVMAPGPREVDPSTVQRIVQAIPPFVTTVGVFVDGKIITLREIFSLCRLDLVQLHGSEDKSYVQALGLPCLKAFRVKNGSVLDEIRASGCSTFLLDTYNSRQPGGTGQSFDWKFAAQAGRLGRVILAGGLTADNVAAALSIVRPYGVDVSSGVEESPGRKDHEKVKRFIDEVRLWDYRTNGVISADSADDLFRKR